jgi:hypothetical protein
VLLFDLDESIGERRDLAADRPEVVHELLAEYLRWEADMREPLWTPVNDTTLEIFLSWVGRTVSFRVTV